MESVWNQFLLIISQEVGSRVVDTWFKALVLQRFDIDTQSVYLQAPNDFVREWILKKYQDIIITHLSRLLHASTIKLVIGTVAEAPVEVIGRVIAATEIKKESLTTAAPERLVRRKVIQLNHHYLFDTFVVGPNNSLAYAAAHAVAQNPGTVYNPLFVYGSSGVGKTHLLHAIGNAISAHRPTATLLYQPAERFVSEFINAIRFDKVHQFQTKYQHVDVLLVDDIQCIANKEQTQEAFFYIFNALYDASKQIVFSSDTYPQDMSGIAERLRSRMASGLVVDMYVPSLETKVAILKKKAELAHNMTLSDDVASFIASRVISNVRELEGALIRVMACAVLTKQPLSLALAHEVLAHHIGIVQKDAVNFEAVIAAIDQVFSCSKEYLCAQDRSKRVSHVRHIAMYLMRKCTGKSLRDIGAFLGDRDHATVKHGIEKIEHALLNDGSLQKQMKHLEQLISSS